MKCEVLRIKIWSKKGSKGAFWEKKIIKSWDDLFGGSWIWLKKEHLRNNNGRNDKQNLDGELETF